MNIPLCHVYHAQPKSQSDKYLAIKVAEDKKAKNAILRCQGEIALTSCNVLNMRVH